MIKNISFEFFSPKNKLGYKKLRINKIKLLKFSPIFISLTFKNYNKSQNYSLNNSLKIFREGDNLIPHLINFVKSKNLLLNLLKIYKFINIKNFIILRGDISFGFFNKNNINKNIFKFIKNKNNIIKFASSYLNKHFNSNSFNEDIEYGMKKILNNTKFLITQYFYNINNYLSYIDKIYKFNKEIEIIPGIMPIFNSKKIINFSKEYNNEIYKNNLLNLNNYKNNKKSYNLFNINNTINLCNILINNGIKKLHFYTLNKFKIINKIIKNLK
ncbi:putative 5,10-methylenetetrahydrofolate reductase [Candidatus Zinderia insecticola CARI]|uniref:Methylenetetrahydrofolate reductase n=1 Tax=Zinderia insecticola (strain CARI) TaxID=871271 RepID=E0TJ56_ZINIC|nr:putative 5,10-methylenetetrahydrofolate reductase [Candidatus Zinderia insecticola CARI]